MDIAPIAGYIPVDRQLALAGLLYLPEQTEGAALFADISGFTSLTEKLANELGPKLGAEELTKQLYAVYDPLIAQVHRSGGTVIGFAGDSITCWFEGDDGLRAIGCGLAMQEVLKGIQVERVLVGTDVHLGIKVAIAVGPARRFTVGDPTIQLIDVLAGATLDRMAEAERNARMGEVVIAADLADRLTADIIVSTRRGTKHGHENNALYEGDATTKEVAIVRGLLTAAKEKPWPTLPPDSPAEEEVRPWVLPGIFKRIKAGEGNYLAEMRLVVPLFLRFGGLDYDRDPAAAEKLDMFVRWVQNVLAHYEGSLLQVSIGDKGSVLYAAFGAPVAHDDDALRAVGAALELSSVPPHLGYVPSVQIGIARGRTHTGPYGGMTRHTYGVLGDDVNLAARLMTSAGPNQIMISKRVAKAVEGHYDLQTIQAIALKGKKEPVPVSQVMGRSRKRPGGERDGEAKPTSDGRNLIVGRSQELAILSELLDKAASGHGQVLRLEGPGGIGKSHLANELGRQAVERGMRVLSGMCVSSDRSAYAPWRPVFRALFGLSDDPLVMTANGEDSSHRSAAEAEALERFIGDTDPGWLLRLPLLGGLLGLPIPDNATTAGFEPRLRQSALFDLLGDAVQTLSIAQPLLLIIDDVHWMDEASQGLTQALARVLSGVPVLLLLLSRPPLGDEDVLAGLELLPIFRRLNLEELSYEAVGALVRSMVDGDIDDLALSLIGAVTHGNPFFVEEVVRTLKESGGLQVDSEERWGLSASIIETLRKAGHIVWEEGRWTLAPGASLGATQAGLPDSVESAVLSRLDRLPEGPKLTLKVASVVGMTFPLDLLGLAHPLPHSEPELYEHVTVLNARGFTREEIPPPHSVHTFQHNVTYDVVYGTLLAAQRKQLHSAVGRALERLNPEATTQLAYHTFLGEDWRHALQYQLLAAQQAQKLFANYAGIEHLRKALQASEHLTVDEVGSEQQQVHANLGMMLTYTGQYETALQHLSIALELAQDQEAKAQVCRWIGYLYEYKGELDEAVTWINKGLDVLGDQRTRTASELLALAGVIYTRQGNNDAAQESCDRSIAVAEMLGDKTALAFACNTRGIVAYNRGENSSALAYYMRGLDLYQQVDNSRGTAIASNHIANVYFATSKWVEADFYYKQAREVFRRIGDTLHQVFADNNVGGIARDQGRLDDALTYYESALKAIEQIGGSRWAVGCLHSNLGATRNRRGEIEKAREHLKISLELLEQANVREFLPETHRHRATTELLAGELGAAEAEAREALKMARELSMRADEGCALSVLGEIAFAEGRIVQAENLLLEGIEVLREVGDRYQLARSELAMARVLLKQGREAEATTLLDKCTEIFQELEALLDLVAAQALRSTYSM